MCPWCWLATKHLKFNFYSGKGKDGQQAKAYEAWTPIVTSQVRSVHLRRHAAVFSFHTSLTELTLLLNNCRIVCFIVYLWSLSIESAKADCDVNNWGKRLRDILLMLCSAICSFARTFVWNKQQIMPCRSPGHWQEEKVQNRNWFDYHPIVPLPPQSLVEWRNDWIFRSSKFKSLNSSPLGY